MTPAIGGATGLTELKLLMPTTGAGPVDAASGTQFQDLLLNSIQETAGLEHRAQTGIAEGLREGEITLAETVVAMREADLAMRLMMQVQRKLVDTWNELRNMQV